MKRIKPLRVTSGQGVPTRLIKPLPFSNIFTPVQQLHAHTHPCQSPANTSKSWSTSSPQTSVRRIFSGLFASELSGVHWLNSVCTHSKKIAFCSCNCSTTQQLQRLRYKSPKGCHICYKTQYLWAWHLSLEDTKNLPQIIILIICKLERFRSV